MAASFCDRADSFLSIPACARVGRSDGGSFVGPHHMLIASRPSRSLIQPHRLLLLPDHLPQAPLCPNADLACVHRGQGAAMG